MVRQHDILIVIKFKILWNGFKTNMTAKYIFFRNFLKLDFKKIFTFILNANNMMFFCQLSCIASYMSFLKVVYYFGNFLTWEHTYFCFLFKMQVPHTIYTTMVCSRTGPNTPNQCQ